MRTPWARGPRKFERRFHLVCLGQLLGRVDLADKTRNLTPGIWIHRQQIDDVGPVLPVLVAIAHHVHGDRVAVGIVADQSAADVCPSRLAESRDQGPTIPHDERNTNRIAV
jgi:hypothetical protein